MARGQGDALLPQLQDALRSCDLVLDDMDGIAVACGPGSFTGIRIGIAFAKGLGEALQKPVMGVTHFAAKAAMQDCKNGVGVILQDGKGGFFAASFDASLNPVKKPFAAESIERCRDAFASPGILLAGFGQDKTPDKTSAAGAYLYAHRFFSRAQDFSASPLYMRGADVTIAGAQRSAV